MVIPLVPYWWRSDEFKNSFQKAAGRLDLQAKVNVLKQPFCVGWMREAVLREVENEVGRLFQDDLWQLVEWLQTNRPDIDILSPPQPPEGTF